ncbi:MAG: phosphate acetyltransferase [Spirochaetes bacterium GWB1_48_6]|nr:MAG: phosphate acetyltransferase [Spirochaetes bacterium GWB1_48_6]
MTFMERMKSKARELKNRLVLPEGMEPRTIAAAKLILDQGVASEVTLIGSAEAILAKAKELKVDLTGVKIQDPTTHPQLKTYAAALFELRKHKGMTPEAAEKQIQDVLWWGAMMVNLGDADAMVAGADNSTGNVLRAALPIIRTAPGSKYASSCFVMEFPDKKWGQEGLMIFADCAVNPDPDAPMLAEIAIASAASFKKFIGGEPAVAMLSFSSKGSASHADVDKVVEATRLIKEKAPGLNVDGELQADAALVVSVATKKAPGSSVAGKANTLVFPDLGAGNIGYKMVQRFANAEAYGPFLQGFAKPVSDLSRGCSIDDILNTAAVTLVQVGN